MSYNTIANLVEVEYLMNSKYLSSVQDVYEKLLSELKHTPPTASIFLIKDKVDWMAEITTQLENLKEVQRELNKTYFGGRGI